MSQALARSWRAPANDPPAPADRRERLLDPEVLDRYLQLLSLDVEAQRIKAERDREIAEIEARCQAENARIAEEHAARMARLGAAPAPPKL
ncbi:hypothetical protein ACO2Q3_13360 [Caulobacter sp. KR2-114]|uniref:hypothetical protein n=1 Tax=Caulobacter sp. KR2-114 TaxID=3400912 RepID=UPI003C0A8600